MYQDLSHLTHEQMEDLVRRYYRGEHVRDLMEEYHISGGPSQLCRMFPPMIDRENCCEYCGTPLQARRVPHSTAMRLHAVTRREDWACPVCGHRPYAVRCRCQHCRDRENADRTRRIRQICDAVSPAAEPVDLASCSLREKVYLGALCQGLLDENLYSIRPLAGSGMVLTPDQALTEELYRMLLHRQLIILDPESQDRAFDLSDSESRDALRVEDASYFLHLEFSSGKAEVLQALLDPSEAAEPEEALQLWREIAVAECIEYLLYQLKKIGFPFHPGEKTHQIFTKMLEDYSVSQIYYIIWAKCRDASHQYLERRLTRQNAANLAVNACGRYAEQAKLRGWEITSYGRLRDLPQSQLSSFYFNRVLKIGDQGFQTPPHICT